MNIEETSYNTCNYVTIIMPTYNCESYIKSAVDSILAQTYKHFELLIIDDGSNDNTKYVIENFIKDERVRYIHQDNKGVSGARNRGLLEARGDYIAFLDSDDLWMPTRLERTLVFLEKYKYDWVCSAFIRKERNSGKEEIKHLGSSSLNDNGSDVIMLKNGLFYFSAVNIHTNTILAKKSLFDAVGYFDESYHSGEDWDMWLRFEEAGFKGGYLEEPLAYYMIRNDGITKSKVGRQRDYHLELAEKHANILGLQNKYIRRSLGEMYFKYADLYFNEHRNFFIAAKYIAKGLYYNPDFSRVFKGFRALLR